MIVDLVYINLIISIRWNINVYAGFYLLIHKESLMVVMLLDVDECSRWLLYDWNLNVKLVIMSHYFGLTCSQAHILESHFVSVNWYGRFCGKA